MSARVPVYWVSLHTDRGIIPRGYWDQGLIENLLEGRFAHIPNWPEFHHELVTDEQDVDDDDVALWMIPAMHHVDDAARINDLMSTCRKAIVWLCGDEEMLFPVEQLSHPNMVIWRMTPHGDQLVEVIPFPDGRRADTIGELASISTGAPDKTLDIVFRGQINHDRRRDALGMVQAIPNSIGVGTDGFTQGISRSEYLAELASAKFVACPAGVAMPSSFRVFEALEAGCIPIVDDRSPRDPCPGFWEQWPILASVLPRVAEWSQLPAMMRRWLPEWATRVNLVQSAWHIQRRLWAMQLALQVGTHRERPIVPQPDDQITVIVTTSPIPSNPSTGLIADTIRSVRHHLPSAQIIIACDGVRDEQDHLADGYREYVRRLLWHSNLGLGEWANTLVLVASEHLHQANLTRLALCETYTPLMLFVEHDTPFDDRPIDWHAACAVVSAGWLNVLRFHHEDVIPHEHDHMMVNGLVAQNLLGMPVLLTAQWSQRPHLASVDYYGRMLHANFTERARTMIEDHMHGVVHNAWRTDGFEGWGRHKVGIYAPEGGYRRTLHSDGREGEPKFDMVFDAPRFRR